MSENKLMDAFNYIDDKYLEIADKQIRRKKPVFKYAGLIAASVVLALTSVSVGAVAGDWFGLRNMLIPDKPVQTAESTDEPMLCLHDAEDAVVEEAEEIYAAADVEGLVSGKEKSVEDSVSMVSLSGYMDSPESKALAEWMAFLDTYDQDQSILRANDKLIDCWGDDVTEYFVYSDEMADKLREIAGKYNLYLHRNIEILMADELADRIGGAFWADNCGPGCGYIYDDGTFQYDADFIMDNREIGYQFRRSTKGSMNEVALNISDVNYYKEWKYENAYGDQVILALGPAKALIFGDYEKCFVVVNILAGSDEGISEADLENMADLLNLSIIK